MLNWLRRIWNSLNRKDSDLDAEVRSYIDLLTDEKVRSGMTPVEARRAALIEAGKIEHVKEDVREAKPGLLLRNIAGDLRYGFRILRNSPGFTTVVILSLALGIGANVAIFSAINAILLRPLPYKDPDRLAMLWLDNRRLNLHEDLTSYPNFEDWRSQNHVFEAMSGFTSNDFALGGTEEPLRVDGAIVDAKFFPVLGVSPTLGRVFTESEDQPGHDTVAIISDGLWRTHFGGDPQVIGRTILLNDQSCTVIGVMPPEFGFPTKLVQIWKPLAVPQRAKASRGGFWMSVVGRLKPGIGIEKARAEMSAIGTRLEMQYPDNNRGYGVYVKPLLAHVVGNVRYVLYILLAAVSFVLMIACANVANLLLARGAAREREMALRSAIGAGRKRLITQLLTEGVALSLLAGTLGYFLAFAGIRLLPYVAPKGLPRLDEITMDARVLAFSALVSIVSAIIFGLTPALRISRVDLNDALREGGRSLTGGMRSQRLRTALMIAEVALAVVLLTGGGLMVRSLLALQNVQPGFRAEGVLTMHVSVPRSKYPEGAQAIAWFESVLARIQAVPGVESAGLVSDIFLSATPNSGNFSVEGHPDPPPEQRIEATVDTVSPGYFSTMGTPLVQGRFFTLSDSDGKTPVVIVNQSMAKRFWPSEDPIGRRFRFGNRPWMTVVGVVADQRRQGLERPARAETFLPFRQRPGRGLYVVIRMTGDPMRLAGLIRSEIRSLEKSAIIDHVETLEQQLSASLLLRRFETKLLTALACVALLLAAIGIYGVTYYSVAQRTHELGVRIALGAKTATLLRMVVGQAVRTTAIGAVVGLAASLALVRSLSNMLYGVSFTDPLTIAAVLLVLGLIAALASYVPARRATNVDPMIALRWE